MSTFGVKLTGEKAARLRFTNAADRVDNLPVAFDRVAAWFAQLERRRFDTKGFGKWDALTRRTMARKRGHERMMRRTDALIKSLTVRGYRGSIRRVRRDRLELGTRLPYAKYQHARRKLIALRPADRRQLRQIILDHITGP